MSLNTMTDDRAPSVKILSMARRLRCCRRLHIVKAWARGCGSGKGSGFRYAFSNSCVR